MFKTVDGDWVDTNLGNGDGLFASIQTYNGNDAVGLRKSGSELRMQEEQSSDSETGHTTEAVGYVKFDG